MVSYSSNSQPTLDEMVSIMARHKHHVSRSWDYKYSFGNQAHKVGNNNNDVQEYILSVIERGRYVKCLRSRKRQSQSDRKSFSSRLAQLVEAGDPLKAEIALETLQHAVQIEQGLKRIESITRTKENTS